MNSYFKIAILVASFLFFAGYGLTQTETLQENVFQTIPFKSQITSVQPMTGIVLWEQLDNKETDAIQMEYSYMRYNDVVKEKGVYDWTIVEKKLNSVASRSHQAILRFWDTYPGRESTVPV